MLLKNNMNEVKNKERISAKGLAVQNKDACFSEFDFTRHPLGDHDVLIETSYVGICHSDIHSARSEWSGPMITPHYPMVPGHEIAGVVVAVGEKVKNFQVGDLAGVGCMVNSCGECHNCHNSNEQFCENGKTVFTYNSEDSFHNNEITYGGYSNNIVLNEKFAIRVPKDAPLDKVAPLLCAGITTYSPMKFSNVKKGDKVGVAGFGGLGVMAVKYAISMGADVYVFARNKNKEAEALKLGVKHLYTSTQNVKERFDFIISTIPTAYDVNAYIELLKANGELAIVGLPPAAVQQAIDVNRLVFASNRKVYGSLIGGIKETQEMLDYSIKHNIYPEIEHISVDQIDEAYENLQTGKAKFRYVIDMSTLK